jgi:CSLREA domain-containing protein
MVEGSIATRPVLKLIPIALLLAGLTLTAQPAAATTPTYTVNTTADTHKSGAGCHDISGKCSLRAAVEAANAQPAGSVITINVPGGHYFLNPAYGSLILNGNNTVTITGAGSTRTIVDGGCGVEAVVVGGFSVFQNGSTLGLPDPTDADNLTMTDLEITHGCADNGGGILNGGNLTLTRVHITDNYANFDGGGVANTNDFFPAIINDSTIDYNVSYAEGGGIFNEETLTLHNDHVDNNVAVTEEVVAPGGGSAEGGGVFTGNHLVADYSTFNFNQAIDYTGFTASGLKSKGIKSSVLPPPGGRMSVASKGGAIFVVNNQTELSNNQIAYNQAGLGGAIYNEDRLTSSYDRIVSNQAGCSGGGTFNAPPLQAGDITFSGPGQLYLTGDFVGTNSAGYAGLLCELYFENLILSGASYAPRPFSGGGSYNDGTETITGGQYQRNFFVVPGGGATSQSLKPSIPSVLNDPSPCGFFVAGVGLATCGGGIYSGGEIVPIGSNPAINAQDFLSMVRVAGNQAVVGGGLFHEFGQANVQTSVFAANRAAVGGAIADFYNYGEQQKGTSHLSVSSTTILGNIATLEAGGIFNFTVNQVLLNGGLLTGNVAPVCPNWLNGITGSPPFGTPPFDPTVCQ